MGDIGRDICKKCKKWSDDCWCFPRKRVRLVVKENEMYVCKECLGLYPVAAATDEGEELND